MSKIKLLLDVVENMRSLADSIEAIADAMTATDEQNTTPVSETPKNEKPTIGIEQIRAVLAEKSQAGNTADVRTLLGKYGATKLSEIKAEFYAKLLKDAEEL